MCLLCYFYLWRLCEISSENPQRSDLSPSPILSTMLKSTASTQNTRDQKVTITAAGRIYPSADGAPPTLELFTHHDKVRFFITDPDAKFLRHYYSNYIESDLGHIRGSYNLHFHTSYKRHFRRHNYTRRSFLHHLG